MPGPLWWAFDPVGAAGHEQPRRRLGRLDHIFKDLVHVRQAQLYQPDVDHLIVRVVKGAGYDDNGEEARLRSEIRKRIGDSLDCRIEYVPELDAGGRGKLRFVISEVR